MQLPDGSTFGLVVALFIGLVIGAEREQRMAADPTARRTAGIRTFALTATLGAVGALLGSGALVTFGASVAVATLVAYALDESADRGLTTEIAMLLTYALGALAITSPTVALALGLTTAVLLAFRARIHAMVRDFLTPIELRDALIVASAALVVLPMLPDHAVDPWGVLVPFTLWRLVVVVLVIHLAAHVAQRMLGPRWGPPIAGLASGFVSAVAAVAAMSARAKEEPASAIAAATASTVSTIVALAILVGATSPTLLGALAAPLFASGVTAILVASWFATRARAQVLGMTHEPSAPPVNVRGALLFACVVTAVTIGASFVSRALGPAGVLVGAAIAALADTHTAAVSLASVQAAHQIDTSTAMLGILVCLTANSMTKLVLAFTPRPPRAFLVALFVDVIATTSAAWVAFLIEGHWPP